MAGTKPLTAQHTEYEKGKLETPRDGGPPAPHSDRAQAGNAAHRDLRSPSTSGTSPHWHCIGQKNRTRQGEPLRTVSGPDVQGRYRGQPVHGVQATRWIAVAVRATVTGPKDMHRDGTMRAGTAAP